VRRILRVAPRRCTPDPTLPRAIWSRPKPWAPPDHFSRHYVGKSICDKVYEVVAGFFLHSDLSRRTVLVEVDCAGWGKFEKIGAA